MPFPCFPVQRRAAVSAASGPAVALAALLCTGTAFAGPLVNGDFSAGFDGWSGQTIACSTCDGSDDVTVAVTPPPGAFSGNFSVASGTATLTTSFATDSVYNVALFQVFDVDMLIGGATSLLLHYVLGINLSDPTDIATAFLGTTDGALTVQLLPGVGPLDITAFAGRKAQLAFGVTDFDDAPDRLSIGGLTIKQVPLPATALLLLTGLGLITRSRTQPARPARATR